MITYSVGVDERAVAVELRTKVAGVASGAGRGGHVDVGCAGLRRH